MLPDAEEVPATGVGGVQDEDNDGGWLKTKGKAIMDGQAPCGVLTDA
jgi:hypothetical protein